MAQKFHSDLKFLGSNNIEISGGIIDNLTGDLVIQNSVDDSDIIFKSDDINLGSGTPTEYFRLDGSTRKVEYSVPLHSTSSAHFEAESGVGIYGGGYGTFSISNSDDSYHTVFGYDGGAFSYIDGQIVLLDYGSGNETTGTAAYNLAVTSDGTLIEVSTTVDDAETAKRIEVTVKNVSGGSLSKGTVVHASPTATPPSGNVIEVIAADYDDATKMPAIGILNETIANEAEGAAVMMGAVSGIATSSFSIGDELYVGNNGALTNTKPATAGQLIQKIAVVIKSHASNGLIKIFGAGRSNDVPLPLYIDNTNQRVGVGEPSPTNVLHVSTDSNAQGATIQRKSTTEGAYGQLNFTVSTSVSATPNVYIRAYRGTSYGSNYLTLNAGTAEALRVAPSSKVGVGGINPVNKLHVYQNDSATSTTSGITIEQDGTGDAQLQWLLTGVYRWVAGIDNSDGDKFKIGRGNDWSLGQDLIIDTSGNATFGGTLASGTQTITSSDDQILTLDQTSGGWNYIGFESDGTRNFYVGQDSGENFIIGADSAKTFAFSNFSSLSFAAAQLNSTGNVLPNTDSTYNIGTTSLRYANIYADTIDCANVKLTNVVTNRILKFDGTDIDDSNLTDNGSLVTSSVNFEIAKHNPVIELNDNTSPDDTDMVAYISLQRGGTERGWMGYGSSGNSDLTIRNTIGTVALSSGSRYFKMNTAGNITAAVDVDTTIELGKAHIGWVGWDDHAGFSHIDQNGTGSYALLQASDGDTFVNAASGRKLYFRINNVNAMQVYSVGDIRYFGSTNYHRSDTTFSFLTTTGNAQTGKFKGIQLSTSYTGTIPDNGILFGTDTNLYRSSANWLNTDDNFVVGGGILLVNQSGNLTSEALQVNGFIDITNVGTTALRWYNGSTFRGGLGTDQWADAGNATDLTMYVSGANAFYTMVNNTKITKVHESGLDVLSSTARITLDGASHSGFQIYSPSNAHVNIDSRDYDTNGAALHKYNRNSAGNGYKPYYERWYDGDSYHDIGVTSNNFEMPNAGLHVDGRLRCGGSGSDLGTQLCLWADSSGYTYAAGYTFQINTGSNNSRTLAFKIDQSKNATFYGPLVVNSTGKFYSAIGTADDVRTGLAHYDTTSQAAGVGGQLVLGYKYISDTTYTEGAILKMYKENSTSGHYGSGLKFQVRNNGASLSTKMHLNPSGSLVFNKAVGTYNSGGFGDPKIVIKQTSNSDWGGINIEANGNDSVFSFSNNDSEHVIGGSYRASAGFKDIVIKTSSQERMRFDADATSIGFFGQTSPTVYTGYGVLHIGTSSTKGLVKFGNGNTWNGPEIYAIESGGSNLRFNTNSTTNVMNLVGTRVGIGRTNPTQRKLEVEGGILVNASKSGTDEDGIFFRDGFVTGNKYNCSILAKDHNGSFPDGISINGYDGISFCTGSNNRNQVMIIDVNGRVGIGTGASSTRDLDVNGGVQASNLTLENARFDGAQEYPIAHYTGGKEIWSINPHWTNQQLQDYFNNSNVSWSEDSTAPGGYAIYINGGVNVGGQYDSGFPYIQVDEDAIYYMEVWIRNAGSGQSHYMGSIDYNHSFSSLGGNPGSFGYWVMSNDSVSSSYVKRSGIITGFGNSVGQFKSGTKYFTPQALFNYGAGSGTRACYISGWRVIRIDKQEFFANGTNSVPSIAFAGDANTGIYRPGSDQLGLVAGGSRKLMVESTGVQINNGFLDLSTGNTIRLFTGAGNLRGYIQATDTNDKHLAIATSGGEDIAFLDGGTSGDINAVVRGDGNFVVSGDVIAYGSPSDKTLKENIKPIEGALDKVEKLQGVTFDWKKEDITNIKKDIGFIAQDVQKVLPELVRKNDNGKLSMRHQGVIPVLVEAIKELKAEIEQLKKQIK